MNANLRKKETTLMLSGGLDSVVAAYLLKEQGYDLVSVYVDYGIQSSQREKSSALYFSNLLRIPLNIVSCSGVGQMIASLGNVGQLDGGDSHDPGPHPDIKAENEAPGRISAFYNTISSGIYISRALKMNCLSVGVVKDDFERRPNIEEFLSLYGKAIQRLDTNNDGAGAEQVFVLPCKNLDKPAIVKEAVRMGVQMDATYSCIQGRILHCGICGACKSRMKGFELAGIDDPTWYEDSPHVPRRSLKKSN